MLVVWQIEPTKEARSICRDCNRRIRRGEHRFGNYDLDRWYHLECAVVRDSRAFAPFAQEAAALMRPAAPDRRAERVRNAELEARLVAQPDDTATMAVFADWLQSNGDPWGELIALALDGKSVTSVLKEHLDDLIGSCPPRMFEWRYGFIDKATFDVQAPSNSAFETLEAVFALRTSVILRELEIPAFLGPDAVTALNEQASRTLRHLSVWFTSNIRELALPSLEQLTILTPYRAVESSTLTAAQLPRLTRLKLRGRPLSLPVLGELLDSALVQRLTWLEITDGALDAEGEALVARRAKNLEHIPVLNFSLALDDVFPQQKAAWRARTGGG